MITAEYIDHMGNDLRVVNAARVSFDKESDWAYLSLPEQLQTQDEAGNEIRYAQALSEKDGKLIRYLATHGHWTPFAHPQITMRETVPVFVSRQRLKHVVGFTYNEVSRRYVDDEPTFYTPDAWRERPQGSVKQGSGGTLDADTECYVKGDYQRAVDRCFEAYQFMIEQGVAPEQARMVLPQSMLTSYYVTGSLSAWARAYSQRIDPHAQQEIQHLAHQWGDIIEPLFPQSWAALTQGAAS